MENRVSYNILKNNFLNYLDKNQGYMITNNEHEALEDIACALNLGKTAYLNHLKMWDDMNKCECCGWTDDDTAYLKALKSIQSIIEL